MTFLLRSAVATIVTVFVVGALILLTSVMAWLIIVMLIALAL